jgi:hypothetical protein
MASGQRRTFKGSRSFEEGEGMNRSMKLKKLSNSNLVRAYRLVYVRRNANEVKVKMLDTLLRDIQVEAFDRGLEAF